jgi:hypothetical protein
MKKILALQALSNHASSAGFDSTFSVFDCQSTDCFSTESVQCPTTNTGMQGQID